MFENYGITEGFFMRWAMIACFHYNDNKPVEMGKLII